VSEEHSPLEAAADGAKRFLGCGLQTIAILVGVVLLFALIFGIGLWIFGLFT